MLHPGREGWAEGSSVVVAVLGGTAVARRFGFPLSLLWSGRVPATSFRFCQLFYSPRGPPFLLCSLSFSSSLPLSFSLDPTPGILLFDLDHLSGDLLPSHISVNSAVAPSAASHWLPVLFLPNIVSLSRRQNSPAYLKLFLFQGSRVAQALSLWLSVLQGLGGCDDSTDPSVGRNRSRGPVLLAIDLGNSDCDSWDFFELLVLHRHIAHDIVASSGMSAPALALASPFVVAAAFP